MNKRIIILLVAGIICLGALPLSAQDTDQGTQLDTQIQIRPRGPTYNPEGRRDPFRDLLAGQDPREKGKIRGLQQLAIEDAILIGIVKHKGNLTAIINDAQGFPYYIKTGDNFLDGFVLNVNDSQVIFRKTKERGIPLTSPKDIVKEIKLEER
jgi:Tfp pilus assembly protein PilP